MKKLFLLLLVALLFLWAFIGEGGALRSFYAPTVILPLFLGTFLTTLFSFEFVEIINAFKDAFTVRVESDKLNSYKISMLVVKNMESSTFFWSLTIVTLGLIMILAYCESPRELGSSMSVAFLALLFGFGTRAALYIPMENSLKKKILLAENTLNRV